ncbi:NUDIX hydrolase [Actinokineospora bangkokensis]|uniref:NUDIX hydrolase n=1 Tax=Actinokineospora bangkokensis TaxID=1193682 RepID=A0A1Q9LC54_9PSEU|nr:NUDIX hydrolase [Actinokineospora bangkokensis]OLR89611.1 NUDIX hydrolase [Actinokineospora bangkokensis]
MDLLPFDEYAASLNRKRTAAGVLFRDQADRVLLIETTYKTDWEIPGGVVEAEEAPWTTAAREVREEVGIDRPLGRLLVIQHIHTRGVMPEGLAFVFDGGLITEQEVAALPTVDPEVRSLGLYDVAQAEQLTSPALFGRIQAALTAVQTGELTLRDAD